MKKIRKWINRKILKYVIRYIYKNFYNDMTPIWNESSNKIIAWEWKWSTDLEREIGVYGK